MFTQATKWVALFTSLAFCAPQYPVPSPCNTNYDYDNITVSPPYDLPPQLVAGARATAPGSISPGISYEVGVEKSFSLGVEAGFDLEKVKGLAISAGYSQTWSTSVATSITTTQECPNPGVVCGLIAIARMVKTTGRFRQVWGSGCGNPNPLGQWNEFTVVAPLEQGVAPSMELRAVVRYDSCLMGCNDTTNGCPSAFSGDKVLTICPGSDIPQPGAGNFGGTLGSIPINPQGPDDGGKK